MGTTAAGATANPCTAVGLVPISRPRAPHLVPSVTQTSATRKYYRLFLSVAVSITSSNY